MKKNSLFLFLISAILFFVMAFSFVMPQHVEECSHTACDYCIELEQAENSLLAVIETHGECFEDLCEDCSFVEEQQEILRIKKIENHSCQEVLCTSCLHMAFGKRLRMLLCVILAIATLIVSMHIMRCVLSKKAVFARFVTLITLKVKLTD